MPSKRCRNSTRAPPPHPIGSFSTGKSMRSCTQVTAKSLPLPKRLPRSPRRSAPGTTSPESHGNVPGCRPTSSNKRGYPARRRSHPRGRPASVAAPRHEPVNERNGSRKAVSANAFWACPEGTEWTIPQVVETSGASVEKLVEDGQVEDTGESLHTGKRGRQPGLYRTLYSVTV